MNTELTHSIFNLIKLKNLFLKFKLILFLLIFNLFTSEITNAFEVKILIKLDDKIITNQDIIKEKEYLEIINPNIKKLENKVVLQIARNSIIKEKVKEIELNKNNISKNIDEKILNEYIKNIYLNLNFENIFEFEKFLKEKKLKIEFLKNKMATEILWNNLIISKYSQRVKVDKSKLRTKIINSKDNIVKSYNLSEIVFDYSNKENLKDKYQNIIRDIEVKGFESSAIMHSISDTSKTGGELGWINEKSLSEKIKKNLDLLKINQHSKPIIIPGGAIIIKINDIKTEKLNINLDNELKKMILQEQNNQLNQFSILYFNKVKKNITINEL